MDVYLGNFILFVFVCNMSSTPKMQLTKKHLHGANNTYTFVVLSTPKKDESKSNFLELIINECFVIESCLLEFLRFN